MRDIARRCILPVALLLVVAVAALVLQIAQPRAAIAAAQQEKEAAGQELLIVMYHHMLKEQSRWNKYTISPDEFRQDMQYLKDNGYTAIGMTELIAAVNSGDELPERPVIITFDDGYESFHEYAFPILKEYGFKAVYSVVGKYADQYTETEDHHIRYSHCNWEQLLELQSSGLVEIQNHTYDLHVNEKGRHGAKKMQGESVEDYRVMLREDVGRLQEECYEYLGMYPSTFTYPFGQISPEALPVLRELGFQAALTCSEKLNYITGDVEQLYHLCRFNRPHGTSLQTLVERARQKQA